MHSDNDAYAEYSDRSGEKYFCPLDAVPNERVMAEDDLEECVEATTVGRYAANLNIINR